MSHLLAELSPQTISESGHVRVRPTMQIADSRLANVYACGDVIQNGSRNPNARTAMKQAMIAADNVLLAALGQTPRYQYKPHWADGVIKLTLGLVSRPRNSNRRRRRLIHATDKIHHALWRQ